MFLTSRADFTSSSRCARHATRPRVRTSVGQARLARDLVTPAIGLAGEGFAIDAALAADLAAMSARSTTSPEFRRVFTPPDGGMACRRIGSCNPTSRGTLQLLADRGPDAFYTGPIAEAIVAEMQAGDGLITAEDLSGYTAKVRAATHGTYRGFDIFGPPPPSSGGTCLVEMLNILENFDLAPAGRFAPRTVHLMIESMRGAHCDCARYPGRSRFRRDSGEI